MKRRVVLMVVLLIYVQQQLPAVETVFPGKSWQKKTPAAVGLDKDTLDAMKKVAGGRGCVTRYGYMVYTWGDHTRSADVASASKVFYSHLMFQAITDGKLAGVDEPVVKWRPELKDLNAKLRHKDRRMTFRHLAFQTACLGYTEPPGTAFDYNDATMGFFWDTIVNRVYGVPWDKANEKLFKPKLTDALEFEDPFTFGTSGRTAGRPAISPRDFCRFGLLYLHQGKWKDKQLIHRRLAAMAVREPLPLSIHRTKAKEAEKAGTRSIGGGGNQCDHNGGYSWLWWINGVARDGRRWWYDAPADMFLALGHGGMRGMAVLPSQQIVMSWNNAPELHVDRERGNRAFKLLAEAVKKPGRK